MQSIASWWAILQQVGFQWSQYVASTKSWTPRGLSMKWLITLYSAISSRQLVENDKPFLPSETLGSSCRTVSSNSSRITVPKVSTSVCIYCEEESLDAVFAFMAAIRLGQLTRKTSSYTISMAEPGKTSWNCTRHTIFQKRSTSDLG